MNKEPRYKEVVVDFVDRVHGTGFPEIRPWRPLIAFPVEFVDVVTGTDSCCGFCGQGTRYRFSRNQALEAPISDSCGICGRFNWYRWLHSRLRG